MSGGRKMAEVAVVFTQNSILRISEEKTLRLVELYKKEECLWNTQSDNYKIKHKRREAAEKIAKELGEPFFQPRHVMMKVKNLRNSYCQELKKIAQSMGREDAVVYKPKVSWFAIMDSFIRPHLNVQSHKTGPTLVINGGVIKREPEPQPLEDPDELWDYGSDDAPLHSEFQDEIKIEDGSDNADIYELVSKKRTADHSLPASSPKRSRSNDLMSQAIKEISSQISSMNENLETKAQSEKKSDVFDHFGVYVASMLRNLPVDKAWKLQPKIVEMITTELVTSEEHFEA